MIFGFTGDVSVLSWKHTLAVRAKRRLGQRLKSSAGKEELVVRNLTTGEWGFLLVIVGVTTVVAYLLQGPWFIVFVVATVVLYGLILWLHSPPAHAA